MTMWLLSNDDSGMHCCCREAAAAAAADTWLKYDPAINHRLHLTPIDLLSAMIQTHHNASLPAFLFLPTIVNHLRVAPQSKAFKITVQLITFDKQQVRRKAQTPLLRFVASLL